MLLLCYTIHIYVLEYLVYLKIKYFNCFIIFVLPKLNLPEFTIISSIKKNNNRATVLYKFSICLKIKSCWLIPQWDSITHSPDMQNKSDNTRVDKNVSNETRIHCGWTGTLIHWSWKCKWIQPVRKWVCEAKAIHSPPPHYSSPMCTHLYMRGHMTFIATLLHNISQLKTAQFSISSEMDKRKMCIYTMEHCTVIKWQTMVTCRWISQTYKKQTKKNEVEKEKGKKGMH